MTQPNQQTPTAAASQNRGQCPAESFFVRCQLTEGHEGECAFDAAAVAARRPSVAEAAAKIMAELRPWEIAYAADEARGDFRGFAALHDLFDANMILPDAEQFNTGSLPYYEEIMGEVTRQLVAWTPPAPESYTTPGAAELIDAEGDHGPANELEHFHSTTETGGERLECTTAEREQFEEESRITLEDDCPSPRVYAAFAAYLRENFPAVPEPVDQTAAKLDRIIIAGTALLEFWDNGTAVQPGALVVAEFRAALLS